ncbi:MarR family winged helix-turn-helix transcriptional regulator [Ancylobacter sp. VNQ12]|uniref:MarR family winged helix-turn-helix transcriptional regulator n=1 Tax=Ancylobacter sp. VNQ12 TaxID=3400920 RepID=UPI003C0276CC
MSQSSSSVSAAEAPEEQLHLDQQLCFRLYAASRLITRLYQPLLEPLGLTYPQYIVLMILWEDAPCPVSHVGRRALLNTNTLTPLLKRLEQQGLVRRQRSCKDERVVELDLTEAGNALRSSCARVPADLIEAVHFPQEKARDLETLLDLLLTELRGGDRMD